MSEQRTDERSNPIQATGYARLRRLAEAAIPGPWRECGHNRGGCQCGFIWSIPADAPVAEAIIGEWGDRWPALRKVKRKLEAYMAEIIYGEIKEPLGKANAAFIAAANPVCVVELLNEIELLRARVSALEPDVPSNPINLEPILRDLMRAVENWSSVAETPIPFAIAAAMATAHGALCLMEQK